MLFLSGRISETMSYSALWIGACQSTYKKGFPYPFFDHRARLSCSGRPASAVLVPFGNEAQLPQWLYADFRKKVLWLPKTTRHRLSASLTRSERNYFTFLIIFWILCQFHGLNGDERYRLTIQYFL